MAQLLAQLFSLSLSCAAVIALLLLLTPLLSRRFSPRWRYWAWLFVAVRLVLPIPITLPQAPIQVQAPSSLTAPVYDGMAQDEAAALPNGYQASVFSDTTYEVWYTDQQQVEHHIYDFALFRLTGTDGDWHLSFRWERIWAVGFTLSLLWLAIDYIRLCRYVRRLRRPVDESVHRTWCEQSARLGLSHPAAVYQIPGLSSPMLLGLFHPCILLPCDLPEHVLAISIAHELTHQKRRDLWYKLLLALARCLHWFNPLVWMMVRQANRDVELCCDWDLIHDQSQAERQRYGQAILDQMTRGSRHTARLSTGCSGSNAEVFARFRAMMDLSPRRPGRWALVVALAVILVSGTLVSCQQAQTDPHQTDAWITSLDPEAGTVSYIPLTQEQAQDTAKVFELLTQGQLWDQERTVSLSPDAQLHHTWEGNSYSLNPATILYTVSMSQQGVSGQVELDGDGKAARVQLSDSARLDLSGKNLDFTGYCGVVYAAGEGGVSPLSGVAGLDVDPCWSDGQDYDHAYYTLPLAPADDDGDLPALVGQTLSPSLWELTVVDGAVTGANALWLPSESPEVTLSAFLEAFQRGDRETMSLYATEDCMAACSADGSLQVLGFSSFDVLAIHLPQDDTYFILEHDSVTDPISEAVFLPLSEHILEVTVQGIPSPNSALYLGEGKPVTTTLQAVLVTYQDGWRVDRFAPRQASSLSD